MPAKLPEDERKRRVKARAKRRRDAEKAKRLPRFKQKRAAGRPILYEAEAHCPRARNLALLGLTDAEIADQFGISVDTTAEWKKKPEFSEP